MQLEEEGHHEEEDNQSEDLEQALNRIRAKWERIRQKIAGKVIKVNENSYSVEQQDFMIDEILQKRQDDNGNPIDDYLKMMKESHNKSKGEEMKTQEASHGMNKKNDQKCQDTGTELMKIDLQEKKSMQEQEIKGQQQQQKKGKEIIIAKFNAQRLIKKYKARTGNTYYVEMPEDSDEDKTDGQK
ncbi:hypothetical protein PIB30_054795 [Stylosanthes scabra]|uniref:Uncharacterized protein n=1 Tax=Stylosanthes scabra TaxID=79078 RepID=A0ABU6TJS9_9FABA|nr:hypothetical protein [Stylosanthes scabra]